MPFDALLLRNDILVVWLLLETFRCVEYKILVLSIIHGNAFTLNIFLGKLVNRGRRWAHWHTCILIRLDHLLMVLRWWRLSKTRTTHLRLRWAFTIILLNSFLRLCDQTCHNWLKALLDYSVLWLFGTWLFSFVKWGFHFNFLILYYNFTQNVRNLFNLFWREF